ncbi:hypothetical protein DJ79_09980 [Halorubrum ezzemoulense]|uniref:Uncharacterized protein n=1 Tax=Halorubrum ezzemoulense TaxID=337243 RepID=A0A256JFM8_HALEZ|nr:hypothetical protein DJ79_09980 [Halorubrum ezzemoulense]
MNVIERVDDQIRILFRNPRENVEDRWLNFVRSASEYTLAFVNGLGCEFDLTLNERTDRPHSLLLETRVRRPEGPCYHIKAILQDVAHFNTQIREKFYEVRLDLFVELRLPDGVLGRSEPPSVSLFS